MPKRPLYGTDGPFRAYFRFHSSSADPTCSVRERYWTWQGIDVHLDELRNPEAHARLLFVHGAGGYGRMFLKWASEFAAQGLEVIAPDLPGYGLTRCGARTLSYDVWLESLQDLVLSLGDEDPRPLYLFGASMGGLLSFCVADRVARARPHEQGLAGVIATCLIDPSDAGARRHMVRYPFVGRAAPALLRTMQPLDTVRVPIRWVTPMTRIANDADLSRLCSRDPLGGGNRVSVRFLRTYLNSRTQPESWRGRRLLVVHPGEDRWTPAACTRRFFDRVRANEKRFIVAEGAGHFPIEEPGVSQINRAVAEFTRSSAP